jgi:hypothetical protein
MVPVCAISPMHLPDIDSLVGPTIIGFAKFGVSIVTNTISHRRPMR